MSRPNILLISADQHRADCFGFMGRKIKTPHLDQLAADGTHFDACITPSVVCQPARASILTGQLCRTHGVHDNGIDLDPAVGERGFAGAMSAAGYQTSYFGKAHFSTYHRTKLMWENAGDTKGAAQTWHSKLPVAFHNSPWTADRAIEWLKHGRDEDKPFCTWVSFPDPHHPFDCPEPWSRQHDPAEVDLPENRTRSYEGKPWWHKAALEGEPSDPKFADIRKAYSRIAPQTDEQLREIIANTYGQIALIDDQVGRLMNALRDAGLDENTIVIYISDHGDWLGDHGLILKGPGPTFFDYGAAEPMLDQHGTSLRPLIEGDATRTCARNEWGLGPGRVGVALELRTVRTRTHKLTVDLISEDGELYDLQNDPEEMHNLFGAAEADSVQRQLMAFIHARPDEVLPDQPRVGTA